VRYLEVRRHSKRERPNQNLSQWGIELAQRVGSQLGFFDRVVTSPLQRCSETAVTMGLKVNATYKELAGDDGSGEKFPCMDEIDWQAGYAGFALCLKSMPLLADFVERQARLWSEIVQTVPEGASVLLIGHGGGFLEGTAVFCLPRADHADWGPVSSYCEGVRLDHEGDRFVNAHLLRVIQ
jgi:Histidine phosphatase superfamily (branch 1)